MKKIPVPVLVISLGFALAPHATAYTPEIEYRFSTARGQIIEDISGNAYHAVSGSSLDTELDDVVFTDRGAYFEDSLILMASPSITQTSLVLPSDFTLIMWIFPLSANGALFSSGYNLNLYLSGNKLCHHLVDSSSTECHLDVTIGSNLYTAK